MADYTSIKNIIQEVVKTNNLNEITGANLQMVLLGMINAVDSNNEDDYTLIRQSINTLAQYVDSADDTIRSSIANLLNYVNAQDSDIRSEINSLANSLNSAKFGYNVSVFGLVTGVHTLATAVKNVPSEYRFGGQKITFKTDAGWVTYQNTSLTIGDYEDVDNWVLDSGTTVEGDVTITNNPDYEDLTQNEGGQLKFADKEYNSASYSGLGRLYLRKNIVNGVNTLTQSMINKTNTIYIIQYDYILGEDIAVPANCVLKFDGGSISASGSNDTITGNNTQLFCVDNCLRVKLSGTFENPIYVEWFGIKSGADRTLSNDSIFAEYIIPSMENIGQGVLAMRKTTEVYFSEPIVFNGTYDLDLKGIFHYSGELISTAISIGTDNSRISTGHTYFIEAVYNTDKMAFYNDGNIVENIGVALKNIKQCNITINNVMYFAYCLRLYGNVGGCASNKINSTLIGGHCYYGVHCFGESDGWVNENSFRCKSIISYSTNPADMCAIWLDSENSFTCNGNFFLNPCVEGASTVVKLRNALYNVLYGVRGESIGNSLICDDTSASNTIFYTYISTNSALGEYTGNNKALLISSTESNLPLLWTDNFSFGTIGSIESKVALSTEDDGGVIKAKFKANERYNNGIFGRFVKLSTTDKDANIVIKTNLPGGRIYIAAVKKDFSSFLDIVTPEEAERRQLTQYINANLIKSSITGLIDTLGDIRIFRTGSSSNYVHIQLDRNILSYGSGTDKAFLFIGVKTTALSSNIHTVNVFSDNLCVSSYYADCDTSRIVLKNYFNLNTFSLTSLLSFDTIHNSLGISAANKTIDLSNKTLYNNPNVLAFRGGGTLNVSGTKIYPSFNTIMDGKSAALTVNGMPAAGTLYWQNGKPTWSNGTAWVDATGTQV